jgi:ribulose-bisphosphate carboxylase large chain
MPDTSPDRICVTYLLETPLAPAAAAAKVSGFLSAGTFTRVAAESEELTHRFEARVESIEELEPGEGPSLPFKGDTRAQAQRARVVVSVPLATTGPSLTGLLATVHGSVYGLNEVSGLRLLDLDLPEAFCRAHRGPGFGVEGTRRLTGVHDRPLIASIIKPNVGLTPRQTAAIVAELVEAGIDFVKDDEKMTSPPYSRLEDRVAAVMDVIESRPPSDGRRPMYAFNVSDDDPEEMVRRHDAVAEAGGTAVMVSLQQVGLAGVTFLRKRCRLPIHGHRNGWALLTRHPAFGIEFRAWQKLWRLAGIDHLHVNGIRNKFWETDDSVVASVESCLEPLCRPGDRLLPVIGSGMWAGQVPETWRRTRTVDLMYIAGGGIQGHPGGPRAGVLSIRQAWDAARQGVPLRDHARDHEELRQAIEAFATPGEELG